jgi:AraC-like DNA-binding protein
MSDPQTTSKRPFSEENNRTFQYVDEHGSVSSIAMQEYNFKGVDLFWATSRQEREVRLNEYQDAPTLNMYFSLEGCCGASHNHRPKHYPIGDGQHTISYTPQFDGYYTMESPAIRNFGVVLAEDFFSRLLVDDQACLRGFWDKVQAGKLADITPSAMAITPGQLALIRQMEHCAYRGHMKQLFYEAKIIELFLLQAEQAEKLTGIKPPSVQAKDRDKLYEARDFIREHMLQPLSLLQIARSCGLNDFKLKKGFKEVFGMTVFEYITELKMNYGKQMLTDTSCPVYEVAYMLGYTDPHNFSRAFRKHFGYLPGRLKKAMHLTIA